MRVNLFSSFFAIFLAFPALQAQQTTSFWQVKVDFLEPVVNQGFIVRVDRGMNRHLAGIYAGGGGRVSEFDNAQFDTYQDRTVFLLGAEYQYFLSARRQNSGLYIGGDLMYANRRVDSKVSDESVSNLSAITPGLWFGWLWTPFKNDHFLVDLTILHPRYDFGSIRKVVFQSVPEPYEPQNLLNFLGPWTIGWRF